MPPMGPGNKNASRFDKKVKPNDLLNSIKRLLAYIGKDGYKVGIAILCVLITTSSTLAGTYMLRPIIDNLGAPISAGERVQKLLLGVLITSAIYLVGVGASLLQSRIMIRVSQDTVNRIRNDLFSKLSSLPVKYFDTNSAGDIMSRFTNDVDNIGMMFDSTILQMFSGTLTLVGSIVLMFVTNPLLTVVTLVMTPLMVFVSSTIAKNTRKYFSKQQSQLGKVNGYIEETISGQKVVKVFNYEENAKKEFAKINNELRDIQVRANFLGGIMGPSMNALSQVSYTVTAFVGATIALFTRLGKIGAGSFAALDIGGLTVFVNYSRQFSRPINEISNQINVVMSAIAGAERVFSIMDETPETINDTNKAAPESVKGDVVLENVTFGYTDDKVILKNISLYAHPGQKIAFVGSTGAGKTTVTNLLNRFYDIQKGKITIDGIDILDFNRDVLRQNIAMVLQDTHLFTGTVMENIRYGRLDATDEEVIEAAKTASAHSFIMRLSDGYNTVLKGDGANLSQGQRQLLNIARAAISKAPILILDEATSSVDTRTERHIEHGMDRLMKDRTTFVIAHRLSTVRNANAIMVLENGEIIERGDHDDLLKQGGRYYELCTGKKELE